MRPLGRPTITAPGTDALPTGGDSTGPDPASYDTNVVEPTTSIAATLFPANQYSPCPQEAMGLSYNWSAMSSEINNMSPGGTTNQAIGLALGWMSLVGGGPFTVPAPTPGYTYQQIIILFTDGLNTQDRWYSVQSQIDARQSFNVQQHKGCRYHAIHRSDQYRRYAGLATASELRDQFQQVLLSDFIISGRDYVQPDRH